MTQATIQDWTESQVLLKYDDCRDVKYRVFRSGDKLFQEIREKRGLAYSVYSFMSSYLDAGLLGLTEQRNGDRNDRA